MSMTHAEAYRLLGLLPGASQEEIKKAIRRGRAENHPDRDPSPEARARFQQFNEAEQLLVGEDAADRETADLASLIKGKFDWIVDQAVTILRQNRKAYLDWLETPNRNNNAQPVGPMTLSQITGVLLNQTKAEIQKVQNQLAAIRATIALDHQLEKSLAAEPDSSLSQQARACLKAKLDTSLLAQEAGEKMLVVWQSVEQLIAEHHNMAHPPQLMRRA